MKLLFLEEVESTNKFAKELINELDDKTVIFANIQTAGRGRLGRTWVCSGKNNIYASIILKPSFEMKELYSNLTQYLCVILAQTIEEYGLEPKIKWPNDIQVNGKKISGILAEAVIDGGILRGLILGFGVNLNVEKEKLLEINQPATALNIETGNFIDRNIFLEKLLDKFCLMYDKFIEEGFLLIKNDYEKRAGFLNKEISVRAFDKTITGLALGLTDAGALVLKDKDNNEHILLIGDIL